EPAAALSAAVGSPWRSLVRSALSPAERVPAVAAPGSQPAPAAAPALLVVGSAPAVVRSGALRGSGSGVGGGAVQPGVMAPRAAARSGVKVRGPPPALVAVAIASRHRSTWTQSSAGSTAYNEPIPSGRARVWLTCRPRRARAWRSSASLGSTAINALAR